MMELFQNFDFSANPFNIFFVFDPRFFKYFNGDLKIWKKI